MVHVEWNITNDLNFSVFVPPRNNQKIFLKNSWGQRCTGNSDIGSTLPYFYFYRDVTENTSTWMKIYEGYKNGMKYFFTFIYLLNTSFRFKLKCLASFSQKLFLTYKQSFEQHFFESQIASTATNKIKK